MPLREHMEEESFITICLQAHLNWVYDKSYSMYVICFYVLSFFVLETVNGRIVLCAMVFCIRMYLFLNDVCMIVCVLVGLIVLKFASVACHALAHAWIHAQIGVRTNRVTFFCARPSLAQNGLPDTSNPLNSIGKSFRGSCFPTRTDFIFSKGHISNIMR